MIRRIVKSLEEFTRVFGMDMSDAQIYVAFANWGNSFSAARSRPDIQAKLCQILRETKLADVPVRSLTSFRTLSWVLRVVKPQFRDQDFPPLRPVSAPAPAPVKEPARRPVFDGEIPGHLKCGICLDLLFDAVMASSGHSFCSACIREWLCRNCICPITREPISTANIVPNYVARQAVEAFLANHTISRAALV